MARSDDTVEQAKPTATGLESYRRLVELQRQMIELSQLHEQTKRERDALREEVAREVANQIRARRSFWHRWQRTVRMQLKRWRNMQADPFTRLGSRIEADTLHQ